VTVELAGWIVGVLGAYLAIGTVFALAFVVWGASRIDPGARGMPPSARALIVPGAAALWPLVLVKWLRQKVPPVS
jgi:uncharacterized membrane protein